MQIMDQKKAERRRLKKQSRENASSDSSNALTVVVTKYAHIHTAHWIYFILYMHGYTAILKSS